MDRSRFVEDDNSMFGDPEVFELLIKVIRPADIIEIGSWKGHSANFMADLCKKNGLKSRILCIDTFLGGGEHWLLPDAYPSLHRYNGMPTVIDRFLGNVAARGNEDTIFPLTISSGAGAHILGDMGFKADLIFVDAGHTYKDVVGDIEGFMPSLSEGGVMFGDDYQASEVADAVHDLAGKYNSQVLVIDRKWIYVNEALLKKFTLDRAQLRTSFDGWVHP
jgi:hypothetical protein